MSDLDWSETSFDIEKRAEEGEQFYTEYQDRRSDTMSNKIEMIGKKIVYILQT